MLLLKRLLVFIFALSIVFCVDAKSINPPQKKKPLHSKVTKKKPVKKKKRKKAINPISKSKRGVSKLSVYH